MRHLGGPGLVLLGIADNTPLVSAPAGSVDVAIILLAAANRELWGYYALMATIREVAGAYLTYRLAAKGGQETLERKVGERRVERIYMQFEKHGFLTCLRAPSCRHHSLSPLSWLPPASCNIRASSSSPR